jgi:hypothetical protein
MLALSAILSVGMANNRPLPHWAGYFVFPLALATGVVLYYLIKNRE